MTGVGGLLVHVTVEQPAADEPGDAVCWLHELCPSCGAMPTAEQPDRCWRCGHPGDEDERRPGSR
jgi:ribosomal protein S27AE